MLHLYTLLAILFAQAVSASVFGEVNGHSCLEPKKSNGCCETWANVGATGEIIECPTQPKLNLYCQVEKGSYRLCLPWTKGECVDGEFSCRETALYNGKMTACVNCWQQVQLSEQFYKPTMDKLAATCAQKGGELISNPGDIKSSCLNRCDPKSLLLLRKCSGTESP